MGHWGSYQQGQVKVFLHVAAKEHMHVTFVFGERKKYISGYQVFGVAEGTELFPVTKYKCVGRCY